MASAWCIQFRAFLCKVLLQLKSALFTTIFMLLLPTLVMLVLVAGYRSTAIIHVPEMQYDENPLINSSQIFENHFCTNRDAPFSFRRRLPVPMCYPPSEEFECLPSVRGGSLCVLDATLAREALAQLFVAAGPVVIPTLDAYLGLSAFVTHELRRENPSLFARSAKEGMGHYGKLLLVDTKSANHGAAARFRTFCSNVSVLCNEVLGDLPIFASMADARRYAMENDGEVWAIADITDDHRGVGNFGGRGNHFTISMNYSATPWTTEAVIPTTKAMEEGNNLLYITSGFLTLQNAIQQFYVRERLGGGLNSSAIFQYTNLYGPTTVAMPSPPQFKSTFYKWGHYMPLLAIIAALLSGMVFARLIVNEKARMIRGCMEVMGLRWSAMALGWLIIAFSMDFIAVCVPVLLVGFTFFHYVNLAVLFVLYWSFLCQIRALCLFLSTFFTKPRYVKLAICVVTVCCIMSYYRTPESYHAPKVKFMSLLPCVGYLASFDRLIQHASTSQKFHWRDTVEGCNSVALLVGMTWVSTFIMLVLWSYLDQVLPTSSCCRKHPLFFLQAFRRFLCHPRDENADVISFPWRELGKDEIPPSMKSVLDQHPECRDTENQTIAAVLYGLCKQKKRQNWFCWKRGSSAGISFGTSGSAAVDDVSCALEFGKVNMLIGPSGCGKSTLIGMAVGAVRPDAGAVYICGHSTVTEPEKCRRNIGYCPQADVLWEDLTVEQHLTFYARLKCGGVWDVREIVNDIIDTLNLEAQWLTKARNLSRGQRRRLCVGIALIGDPAVLFLDDPTAGMDVKGRRAVCEALSKGREGRAVLIATHEIDDAERIGDYIHVMQGCTVRDSGSPLVLKSKASAGYVLKCVVSPGLTIEEEDDCINRLVDFVRAIAPGDYGSRPARESHGTVCGVGLLGVERRGRQVSFRFPLALLSSEGVSVVGEIEARRSEFHLQSIGLSIATLQDVLDYLTVQHQPTAGANGDSGLCGLSLDETNTPRRAGGNGSTVSVEFTPSGTIRDDEKFSATSGLGRADTNATRNGGLQWTFFSHFAALFVKRLHSAKWDAQLMFYYIVMPLAFALLSLPVGKVKPTVQPALTLDSSMYRTGQKSPNSTLVWTYSSVLDDAFGVAKSDLRNVFGPYYTPVMVECHRAGCTEALSDVLYQYLNGNNSHADVAIALTGAMYGVATSVTMHNLSSPHAAAQSLNMLYDVVNNQLFGEGSFVTARNEPMPMGPHEEEMFAAFHRIIAALFVILAFILIPANVVGRIVKEVQCGAYHLQCLAGANAFSFWLSAMLFDFLCYVVAEILVLIVLFASGCDELVGDGHTILAALALFTMFGLCHIPFSYVLSFLFKSSRRAQSTVLVGSLVLGIMWILIEPLAVKNNRVAGIVMGVTNFLRVTPCLAFSEALMAMVCTRLANIRKPLRERPSLFSPLGYSRGGLTGGTGTGLLYMVGTFFVCLLLFALLELLRRRGAVCCLGPCSEGDGDGKLNTAAHRGNRKRMKRRGKGTPEDWCANEEMTSYRNGELEEGRGAAAVGLSLQHVTKRYAGVSTLALRDISISVYKGETLTVLGLNDSGKSTILSILAGRVPPTTGFAGVGETIVRPNAAQCKVGYCPQKDALMDNLTPYDHLLLFSRLRGSTEEQIHSEVPRLLCVLSLEDVKNCLVRTLTPAQKRRLSLAVAFVGGTTYLLLDEPTADMDFMSRRQVFAAVQGLGRAKSVILASRHLEEMEVLVDRAAFIEYGRLRYIGTPQELMSHFTCDVMYTVRVAFGNTVAPQLDPLGETVRNLCKCFDKAQGSRGCRIKSVVGRTVTLAVTCDLLFVCQQSAAISEGAIPGLSPVVQVSATQPQLDDILLDF